MFGCLFGGCRLDGFLNGFVDERKGVSPIEEMCYELLFQSFEVFGIGALLLVA